MKVGDLVKLKIDTGPLGFVLRIDKQHYGASTAYKISHVERGKAIRSNMVDIIATTADGIRDRVLVLWNATDAMGGYEYCESTELEVVSECE